MANDGSAKDAAKYALVYVPDHHAQQSGQDSLLRLGAHHAAMTDSGRDQLAHAGAAGWSNDPTRGGLREHTDGDRLGTTRGNRIDVVGGNYKRVLATTEAGGSVREDVERKGDELHATTRKQDVVERTDHSGEKYSTFTGTKHETTIGKRSGEVLPESARKELSSSADRKAQSGQGGAASNATVGTQSQGTGASKADAAPAASSSTDDGNPDGGRKATHHDSEAAANVRGASTSINASAVDLQVNGGLVVKEDTFALAKLENLVAGVSESSRQVAKIGESTLAGVILSETWAGASNEVTNVLVINELTNAVAITSTTNAASITTATNAAKMTDLRAVGQATSIDVGNFVDVTAGTRASLFAGTTFEACIAAAVEAYLGPKLSLMAGLSIELSLAGKASVNVGPAVVEVNVAPAASVQVAPSVEVRYGPKFTASSSEEIKISKMLRDIRFYTSLNSLRVQIGN